ncbi:hypothetical protein Bpfe_031031 [Biomphalaria pfeifferi]|uniref:Uncharacterized protein n=1 Tax=Biomphalaria pfeifferi TaxID=112525 RepID=A0AAD8EUD8_BIOPF|nr:hypothetical protein Bpfe_031031 [Biomphalaria pfeifferi]
MSELIDATFLRGQFDIHPDILDSRLERNIGAASRRLRKWVGEDMYQSVLGKADDDPLHLDFKLAEANLAMHFAILGLNTPITSKGILQNTRSKDFSVITYLSPDKIAEVRQMYLDQAEEIVRDYLQMPERNIFQFVE